MNDKKSKPLLVGENTTGLWPDGTPVVGTFEQLLPLMKQIKQVEEGYERGEFPETVWWGIEDENDGSDIDEYDDVDQVSGEFIRRHRGSTTE